MKFKVFFIFLSILALIILLIVKLTPENFSKPAFDQNSKYDKIVAVNNSRYTAPLSLKGTCHIMQRSLRVLLQYVIPQHALSHLAGWLSNCQKPWLKNYLIRYFLNRFDVNMQEAIIENPYDYASFNSFFTRHLKPSARPISEQSDHIACPVDGFVSQIGKIDNKTLLQVKGMNFDLTQLLGGSIKRAHQFVDGSFATFYLSPKDYHRVHMPMGGKLRETIFIPGKLFSVDPETTVNVPNLFARNERLVCIFDTDAGPMAVILVGAMLVGSIETSWQTKTIARDVTLESFNDSIPLSRGAELGYFKMGSTVIVLFAKNKTQWGNQLKENSPVKMGETIGQII